MQTITVTLPKLHSKQQSFIGSKAKRRVIVAGRRGGKTTGVSILAIEAMLSGRRVLEAAPVANQTEAFWTSCKKFASPLIRAKVVTKNETERRLEMAGNGGRIRCKTAFDADSLRGDYCDLLILDEYSLMKPDTWDEVGAPMLLDNDGDAVFIFTPKRKNHAHSLYARALGDDTGRWQAWHFTSYDNPYLSKPALDEITADMTDDAYRQEIMAEFLENEGAVFRNIAACMTAEASTPEAHIGHGLVMGVDWGKHQDYTAISLGCLDCRMELSRDRFNQIDYILQRGRLQVMYDLWRPGAILAESNSMGEPIIEQLQADGLPVHGFDTTATSKPPLIENLALAIERGEWRFQSDMIWTAELEAYERKVSANTGRSTYSAPEGVHDDTVMSRALMVWEGSNRTWLIT